MLSWRMLPECTLTESSSVKRPSLDWYSVSSAMSALLLDTVQYVGYEVKVLGKNGDKCRSIESCATRRPTRRTEDVSVLCNKWHVGERTSTKWPSPAFHPPEKSDCVVCDTPGLMVRPAITSFRSTGPSRGARSTTGAAPQRGPPIAK